MRWLGEKLTSIMTQVCGSAYSQDAALVSKYTGVELTEEQFDTYSDQFTLKKELGTDSDIHREYYRLGTPASFSDMDIMNDILDKLAHAGVVFDIEEGGDEALFQKLSQAAELCLIKGEWPRISDPYKNSSRLIAAVTEMRSDMKLPSMDCVI